MKEITDRIQFYLDHRSYQQILLGAVIFSNEYGYLGQTEHAAEFINKISKGDREVMVHFVGAGPGAPDLITVRGKTVS